MARRASCDCGHCTRCKARENWQRRQGTRYELPRTFEQALSDLETKRVKTLFWPPIWEDLESLYEAAPHLRGVAL